MLSIQAYFIATLLAKYAVAFRSTSTSSFASASSLRSRLFSASNSLTGRRVGTAAALDSDFGRCSADRACSRSTALPVAHRGHRHAQPARCLVAAD